MLTENLGDAELAVLGAVLATQGDCLDEITLTGEDFTEMGRGELFEGMRKMRANGRPLDLITLSDAYPKKVGFITELLAHAPFASAVGYHAEIIATHSMRRRLSAVGAGLAGIEPGLTIAEMTDRARALVDGAVAMTTSRVRFVRDILPDVLANMEAKDVFVPSPWPTLNAAIGGFRPGAVYVVAARPGVGKTVIAAQIAACLAQEGVVAFSSLEMTETELVARLVSERLAIAVGHIKDARMTEYDWDLLNRGRDKLEQLNIAIDDRSGVAPGDVRTFARSVSREGKLAGIVVDYMQLMTSKTKQDRHLQVAEFSRQLKILAKDMQVPVIALSQLNRNSEASTIAVPKLSDLRESGGIEQDADVVMLLRREGAQPHESLIIDVAKNRHGETGEVELDWQGQFSRAVDRG